VSLDTDKLHRLKGKKFDELYEKHKTKWNAIVASATEYVKGYLEKTGETVRPADISAILQNPIRVDPNFEAFVDKKRLTQKYWVEWFADYIVEQVYPLPEIK
jgi:hypothetical protein